MSNWPPNGNNANESRSANRNYLADNFGSQFDDVILEFQLPEQIVCQACAEETSKSF